MAKKENLHPYFVGTKHGRLSFGQVRDANEISACMLQSGPDGGRHYITMDSTGNKDEGMKGSTKVFSPGTLTVKSGKDIVNYKEGSNKPENISQKELTELTEELVNKHNKTFYGYELQKHLQMLQEDRIECVDKLKTVIVGERLRLFEPQLASFGYNLHLITLPEFHVLAHNMYNLSKDFSQDGIKAYVMQVQRPEHKTHLEDINYTYYKHQSATGTGLEAAFNQIVGSSDTNIL